MCTGEVSRYDIHSANARSGCDDIDPIPKPVSLVHTAAELLHEHSVRGHRHSSRGHEIAGVDSGRRRSPIIPPLYVESAVYDDTDLHPQMPPNTTCG